MKPKEKEVTKNQLVFIVFILGVASQSLVLPSVMAEDAGRDAWIAMLISLVIYIGLFMLVMLIYKLNPDKDLYTVLKGTIGAVGAKIIYALYALLFLYKILLLSNETAGFCSTRLYMSLPWNIYLIPLYLLMGYITIKGLKALARNCEISIAIIALAIIFIIIYSSMHFKAERLLPLMEKGAVPVIKTVGKTTIWFGDFFVIFMMFGKIKHEKGLPKALTLSNAAAGILILLLTVSYFGNYGEIAGLSAHGQVITNMSLTGETNGAGIINSFVTIFWLLAVLLKFGIFFWAANEALQKVFGAKNSYFTVIPLLIAAYALDTRVFINDILTKYAALMYVNYLAAAAHFVLPVIILICALVYRKKRKKEKGDGEPDNRGEKILTAQG